MLSSRVFSPLQHSPYLLEVGASWRELRQSLQGLGASALFATMHTRVLRRVLAKRYLSFVLHFS